MQRSLSEVCFQASGRAGSLLDVVIVDLVVVIDVDVVVVVDVDVVAELSTMEGLSVKTSFLQSGYMAI